MLTITNRAGNCDQLTCIFVVVFMYFGVSSRISVRVMIKDKKISAPAQKNVFRIPNKSGNHPPARGPIRLPAITPHETMPNAQATRSLGACTAIRIVAPDEYPPPNQLIALDRQVAKYLLPFP